MTTRPPARRHLLHHYTTAELEAMAPTKSIPESAILAELRRRDASSSAARHASPPAVVHAIAPLRHGPLDGYITLDEVAR